MAGLASKPQNAARPSFALPLGKRPAATPEDQARDLSEARATFDRLVALERAYDPALAELYAADGVAIEVTMDETGERRRREIPLRRYKAALPFALMLSKKAGERAEHLAVQCEWVGPGWVAVRSQRASSQSREAAPYEALLRREPDGVWRIATERATLIL